MSKKSKIDIHPKPKQTIQVNRPLIMTAAVVVTTVLLLAIVGALTTTKKVKTDTDKIKVKTDQASVVSSELKDLPKDYSDVSAIKKYLPKSENGNLALLMRKFDRLQHEYAALKRELASKRDTTPRRIPDDPKTKQAKSSSLVFSGLSTGVDNLVGGRRNSSRSKLSKKDEDLVASDKQADLIKTQNENAMELARLKGKDRAQDIYTMHNMVKPPPYNKPPKKPRETSHTIMAGTIISATLITGIDTTHKGTLIAQVSENIYDTVTGKFLLIPKGSKLLGQYATNIRPGQRRIMLAFDRLVRPNGSSILLGRPLGVDITGKSGIEGDVNNHWARIIGASMISTILNVGAGIASDSMASKTDNPNSKEKALYGATKGISDVGQKITNQALAIKPTISLPLGHQLKIATRKDMVLTPYKLRKY